MTGPLEIFGMRSTATKVCTAICSTMTPLLVAAGIACMTVPAAAKPVGGVTVAHATAVDPEDRVAIMELYTRYAFYVDQRLPEAWASLFTNDGEHRSPAFDGSGRSISIKGTKALAQAVRDWGRSGKSGVHLVTSPILTRTADGHVHALVGMTTGEIRTNSLMPASFNINGYGMSYDEIVKMNGNWLFKLRDSYTYNGVPINSEFISRK